MKGSKEIIKKSIQYIDTTALFKIYTCYLLTTQSHDELKSSHWEVLWQKGVRDLSRASVTSKIEVFVTKRTPS